MKFLFLFFRGRNLIFTTHCVYGIFLFMGHKCVLHQIDMLNDKKFEQKRPIFILAINTGWNFMASYEILCVGGFRNFYKRLDVICWNFALWFHWHFTVRIKLSASQHLRLRLDMHFNPSLKYHDDFVQGIRRDCVRVRSTCSINACLQTKQH